jgi:hypothetical protein
MLFHAAMDHNALPSTVDELLSLAERMSHELEPEGSLLEMTEVPAAEFRRIINELRAAETAWSAARSAKASAQMRMTAADETLTNWLAKARLVVMLARGSKWSERWVETGFTHRATNVPTRIDLRIALARRLVVFLALHPDFAVPFAEVTAAHGRPIYERMIQTRAALQLATTECLLNRRQRDAAVRVLRRMMCQLRTPHLHRRGVAVMSAKRVELAAEMDSDCRQTVAA